MIFQCASMGVVFKDQDIFHFVSSPERRGIRWTFHGCAFGSPRLIGGCGRVATASRSVPSSGRSTYLLPGERL